MNCEKKYHLKKNKIKKKSWRSRQVFSNPPQTDIHFFRASASIFFPLCHFWTWPQVRLIIAVIITCALAPPTGNAEILKEEFQTIKPLICRINILNATHFSSATRTHTQSHAGDVRTLPTFLHLVFPGVPPLVPAGGSDITPAGGKNQWDFSTAASLRHCPIHAPLIAQRLGGKTV